MKCPYKFLTSINVTKRCPPPSPPMCIITCFASFVCIFFLLFFLVVFSCLLFLVFWMYETTKIFKCIWCIWPFIEHRLIAFVFYNYYNVVCRDPELAKDRRYWEAFSLSARNWVKSGFVRIFSLWHLGMHKWLCFKPSSYVLFLIMWLWN